MQRSKLKSIDYSAQDVLDTTEKLDDSIDGISSFERSRERQKLTREGRWDEMFQRLVEFRNKHGHCIVPNRYSGDRQLGTWVSTQRSDYKAYLTGKSRSMRMTPERARRLEEIGFDWAAKNKSSDIRWESSFIKLLEYVVENGHALVPIGWQDDIQLANWVSTQRQEYKAHKNERKHKKGRTSSLTPERISLLNSIKFVWEAPLSGLGELRKELSQSKAKQEKLSYVQITASKLLEKLKKKVEAKKDRGSVKDISSEEESNIPLREVEQKSDTNLAASEVRSSLDCVIKSENDTLVDVSLQESQRIGAAALQNTERKPISRVPTPEFSGSDTNMFPNVGGSIGMPTLNTLNLSYLLAARSRASGLQPQPASFAGGGAQMLPHNVAAPWLMSNSGLLFNSLLQSQLQPMSMPLEALIGFPATIFAGGAVNQSATLTDLLLLERKRAAERSLPNFVLAKEPARKRRKM